jgi:hypothetical protein
MVRYFSSDEVSTPQGIVPCTICSVGNVIHFLIVELLIVSDNKVKNKTYKTIRTVPISNIKKNREKRQNPYPNTQNMTAHSPLTLQFYIIFLSHNFTLYNNLLFIQYLDSLSPKIRANTGTMLNPHNVPLSNNKNADLSDSLR